MDLAAAQQALTTLNGKKQRGELSVQQYTSELNELRVQDSNGRWWQPDPASGRWQVWDGAAWQPADPAAAGAADTRLMDLQTFREISRTRPWHKRPQKWWDLFSILGGCASAVIWFLYSGVRSNVEGLDLISPVLMVGIPVFMVTYRVQLDDILIPLQPHRKKFPKLALVGAGIAVPFLTAFLLYNVFFVRQYSLMHWNMIIGTFTAYAITREPVLAKGYQAVKGIPVKVPLVLLLLLSVIIRAVTADDCLRDPLNARDCLRTPGYAETIAGTASSAASTAINGPEIVRTLSQQPPPASPPGGEQGQTGEGGGAPQLTPEEAAEEAQRQADEARRLAEWERQNEAGWQRFVDKSHEGMTWDAGTGAWVSPSVAQDIARERAGAALQQDLERRLETMRDQIEFGPHVFDETRGTTMTHAIDRMLGQLRNGQQVNIDEYNRLRTAYGNDIMGNTLTQSRMPPVGDNLSDILAETVETSSREIFTGKDADGKTSYSSMGLRGLLGIATGGQSEWVYTPGSSVYDMQDYVNKGGNSVLEAWRQSAERAVIDEVTGRVVEGGLNVVGNIGGRVFDSLANRYPGKAEWIVKNLDEAREFLTRDRHLWRGTDDATRALSGSGDDLSRALSGQGDDTSRALAGQGDDTSRALSGQGDDTSRALSGQGDDTSRALAGQGDDTSRALSGQGDDTSRALAGQGDDASRAASGQADETARGASEAVDGSRIKNVDDIPRHGEPTDLKDRLRGEIRDLQQQRMQHGQDLPNSFETVKPNVSPDDIVKHGGVTPREQQILKDLGRDHDAIIKVRPRSEGAGRKIAEDLAAPKGPEIHVKTVKGESPLTLSDDAMSRMREAGIEPRTTKYNPEVEHLGYNPDHQDLVVFRKPDPLPPAKPPDMSAREWRQLREAHAQRMSEYINEKPHMDDLVGRGEISIEPDGLVLNKDGKALTSDLDGWSFESRSNPGQPVTPEVRQRILSDPRGQEVFMHDTHAQFPYADASRQVPPGSQPGTMSEFDISRRIDDRVVESAANPNKGLISFDGTSDTVDFVRYTGPRRYPHGLPD